MLNELACHSLRRLSTPALLSLSNSREEIPLDMICSVNKNWTSVVRG